MASYSAFSVVILSLVLATLTSAETYSKPLTPQPYQAGPSYKGPTNSGGNSFEYQNGGSYKDPYGSVYNTDKSSSSRVSVASKADILDRLFQAIDRIIAFEEFAAETLANQDSQQSVLKKQVTQLTLLDLPALEEQNVLQERRLDETEKKMDDLEDLIDDLKANLEDLEYLNAENAKDLKDLEIALANEQFNDSNQVRDIASLLAAVQNLKTKLSIIAKYKLTILYNEIEKVVGLFDSTRDLETSRMCETGVTTLTADDRRNTVLFNTDFGGQVPQIEYGIVGIKSKFVDEDSSKYPPYGKPYDNKYPQNDKQYDPKYPQYDKQYDPKYPQYDYSSYSDREPGTLGGLVVALATTEAITFQLADAAFNNAELVSIDITWNVCSVRPGTRLAKY